jgi:uncharacterized membrane protein YphA (DoxX/SURF4 family)
MFPTGVAGAALFLLRMLVAVNLVWEGSAHWTLVTSNWIAPAFVVPALCLCLGFATPYIALFGCFIQLIATYEVRGAHIFHLGLSLLSSLVLAALGPGAYSIDSRLFGRKQIRIPPRR